MTDDFQTLTRAQVDDAPVKTVVRLVGTWRSEVGIKIDTANGTSMGRWLTTSGMATDFMIAHAGAVLLVPAAAALSKDVPPTLDTGAGNRGLRTTLTKLKTATLGTTDGGLIADALLAAHPAPKAGDTPEEVARAVARGYIDPVLRQGLSSSPDRPQTLADQGYTPVPDTRREDVARALYMADADGQNEAFLLDVWNRSTPQHVVRLYWYRLADTVLAALPAPPVVDEAVEAACAWSDYRKDYGVSSEKHVRVLEHKAFLAGRQSALGTLDAGGVQR